MTGTEALAGLIRTSIVLPQLTPAVSSVLNSQLLEGPADAYATHSRGLLCQRKVPETGTGGPGTADSPRQGVVLPTAHIDGIRAGFGGSEGGCRTLSILHGFLSLLVVTCLTHLPPGRKGCNLKIYKEERTR